MKFSITKQKCGPIARGGGFMSFNYNTGLMWLEDMLEIAYKFDFIHRVNNVTYQLINLETGEVYVDAETGKELTGKRKDLEEYIKNNIEFQTHYIAMLNKYISATEDSYGNVLDLREQQEIKDQEESVEAYLQKAIPLDNK